MSAFNPGGGGGANLPPGVTQAQLDEVKAFNVGLTQAGNKSRPSRSSAVNRGNVSAPVCGGSYSSTSNHPRSGSGVGHSSGASYSVGPSTPSPIAKPAPRDNVSIHLRGRVDVSKTRWANLDDTGTGTLGGHSIGSLNSAGTPPKSRCRSPTRNSILTTQRPQPNLAKLQQQAPVFQLLQNDPQGTNQITRISTPPGRERIVTNWTPNDPSKPFIPAHLHQSSCRKTIQDISKITGIPINELTSDGMSIPAHPNSITSSRSAFAPPASRQADVDQQNWLNLVKSKKSGNEDNVTVDTTDVAGSRITNGTANAQPMLSESRWAAGADNTTQQNGFASVVSAAPNPIAPVARGWSAAPQGSQGPPAQVPPPTQPFVWGAASLVSAQSGQSAQASGWGILGQQSMAQPQPQTASASNGSGWDSVGATRWAQNQPDSGFGSFPPAVGFRSAPVRAPPSNAGSNWAQQSTQIPQGPPTQQPALGTTPGDFYDQSAQGAAPTAPVINGQLAQSSGGWGNAAAAQNHAGLTPSAGHVRIPSQSISDVEMTGGDSILDTPIGNLNLSDPVNQVLTAMPSLSENRWSTPSWNAPSATGFGRPSQSPPARQQSTINRVVELDGQPLTETAPAGFGSMNSQNVARANTTTGPPQSQPFGAPLNVVEFNNRIAQELVQATMRGNSTAQPTQSLQPTQQAQPGSYGPANLQNAGYAVNRTMPGWSNENTASKKEYKVQYLKDSRWAH